MIGDAIVRFASKWVERNKTLMALNIINLENFLYKMVIRVENCGGERKSINDELKKK